MANKTGYKESVSVNGTEKEFATALISAITGLDSSITCSGSPDQYDSADTSIKPTFIFSVNNKQVLKLERQDALSSSTYGFVGYVNTINGAWSINDNIAFVDNVAASYSTTRKLNLSWIVSTNFVLLTVHNGIERQGWHTVRFVYAKNSDKHYTSGSKETNNESKATVYNISALDLIEIDSNPISHGTFTSRFSFTSKPGTIDYIKSSVYVVSDQKQFDISSICDCTTVSVGDTVSLKDGAYLAVGTHQLVKVS